MNSNIYFDCTWPKDWEDSEIPVMASFANIYPKELQEKILKNWDKYGFKM